MTRRLERDIDDWLTAEESGSDEQADRALLRALSAIPRREPGPAFVDRVLCAIGAARGVAPIWRSAWLRVAVLGGLVATGLAVGLLPALVSFGAVTHLAAGGVFGAWHLIGRWLAASFLSWDIVQDVGFALRRSLLTPVAIAVLLANVFVAAASLFGLRRLLGAREELVQW